MKLLLSLLTLIFIISCQPSDSNNDELIIWVNSAKIECTGVGKMTCMQIQKGERLDLSKDWELFYSQIKGFDYQPGFIYKLNIKTEKIESPPADGSSIKYILVEILEKNKDERYSIHDIYVLTHINGKSIEKKPVEDTPTLEINISKMEISGTNGCNNFGGSIKTLDFEKIEFGPIRETMKMCADMMIPNFYSQEMVNTKSYKRANTKLHFYNASNKNILTFKKVD